MAQREESAVSWPQIKIDTEEMYQFHQHSALSRREKQPRVSSDGRNVRLASSLLKAQF
jgi:hypothetical protein